MDKATLPATARPRRHWRRRLLALLVVFTALAWLLQPQRSGPFMLARLGESLGLQITVQSIDYRLRGKPEVTLDGLVVIQPGHPEPLLQARHARIALPWRTLRSRGNPLVFDRIEVEAPRLDLVATQRWLASLPPAPPTKIPLITHGIDLRDGSIVAPDWRIEGISITAATLHPRQPLHARVAGRYRDATISIPARLEIIIADPQALPDGMASTIEARGTLALIGKDWALPAQLVAHAPLRFGEGTIRMDPAKLGIVGRYRSGTTSVPFRLGLYGRIIHAESRWTFDPATAVLAGGDVLPEVSVRGSAVLGEDLRLHLAGSMVSWPQAWPALPVPLAGSRSPFGLTLDYAGAPALDALISLALRRDATRFDARFRRADVVAWLDATAGSPLPPLQGTLATPRLVLPGATLDGVEIEIEDSRTTSDAVAQ